jgi:hypothetical protein
MPNIYVIISILRLVLGKFYGLPFYFFVVGASVFNQIKCAIPENSWDALTVFSN